MINGCWKLKNISYTIPKNMRDRISMVINLKNQSLKSRLKWILTPNEKFSTKSAYELIIACNMGKIHDSENCKWTWTLKCPNKLKFFIWLCYLKRLPTNAYLRDIGINIQPYYTICRQVETITHIFLECPNTRKFLQKNKKY